MTLSKAETQEHYFTFLVVLEWLVHSILGALLEDAFLKCSELCIDLIVRLCMVKNAIIFLILPILD